MKSPFSRKKPQAPKLSSQIISNENNNKLIRSSIIFNPYDFASPRTETSGSTFASSKFGGFISDTKKEPHTDSSSVSSEDSSTFSSPNMDAYSITDGSPPKKLTKSNLERKARISYNDHCCICELELTTLFGSEEIVSLKCGHFAHYDCSASSSAQDLVDSSSVIIHCPICGQSNVCDDVHFKEKLLNSLLIDHNEFSDIDTEDFLSSSTPIVDISQEIIAAVPPSLIRLKSPGFPPITPVDQIGLQNKDYYKKENFRKILNHCASPTVADTKRIRPLLKQSPIITTLPSTPTTHGSTLSRISQDRDFNTEIQVTPEFSTLSFPDSDSGDLPDYEDVNCVLNIKRAEFEPSPDRLGKEEQFKIEICKTKITNELLRNFEDKILNKGGLDVANLGSLVLFDLFELVETNHHMYHNCQVFLFEDTILILDSEGERIIVNQEMSANQIASVTEDVVNGTVIINLVSLRLPEIILCNYIEIIQQKWLKVLSRLVSSKLKNASERPTNDSLTTLSADKSKKNSKISGSVPLIQMSANAWGLIASNESIIPEDVLKLNKLVSKGLGLPYQFLKRQMPRPDRIPITLILCITLKMDKDCEMDQKEYTQKLKYLLSYVLDRLEENDSLGLVFMGVKKESELGHYYGCAPPSWGDWVNVLNLIECYVDEPMESEETKWIEDWKYLEILSALGFGGRQDNNRLKEIVFVHSELINDPIVSTSKRRKVGSPKSSTSCEEEKLEKEQISDKLNFLCNKYDANFTSIIFADEFSYQPKQILDQLRTFFKDDSIGSYNIRKKQDLALDFEQLESKLAGLVKKLHDTSIKRITTELNIARGVKLIEVEKDGQMVDASGNSIAADFSNVSGGFNKLIMFKLRIDLNSIPLNAIRRGCKIDLVSVISKVTTPDGTKTLKDNVDIRLCLNKSMTSPSTAPLNIVVSNTGDSQDFSKSINLSIVPKLSSVRDGMCTKRQIEIMVLEQLKKSILEQKIFNVPIKENIIKDLSILSNRIWGEVQTCTPSNHSSPSNDIKEWSEELCDELDDIKDGYGLRYFQQSNSKSIVKYLELI